MIKNTAFKLLASALFIAFLFSACADDDQKQNTTVFNLRMTDDPLQNVQQVNIDLKTIIVKTDEGKDSIELGTNAGVYNLLDYQGDLDTLIGSTTLNFAFIKEIRLVLGENNSIMADSILYDLKTPSAQQSGLKIKVNADLTDLEVYDLLIDFDAEASVVKKGNGDYSLKPVIRIVE